MCKGTPRIYFEDNDCAVVYKLSGENSQTFFMPLFPHKPFIAPVNRLDTPVSGIMVLAFSAHIQTLFSRAFKAGAVQKEYWAICEQPVGHSAEQEPGIHRLEHQLGFRNKTQKAFVGATSVGEREPKKRNNSPVLKKAVLYWMLCGKGDRYDFMRIHPETGRPHQIRVQMAAAGHPIKGDLKYGARRSEKGGGIRLHSYKLSFTHPTAYTTITVEAPPLQPDNLWKACMEVCLNSTGINNTEDTHTQQTAAYTNKVTLCKTDRQAKSERQP